MGKGVAFFGGASGASVAAGSPPIPNAWMVSAALVDPAHHALSTAQLHDLLVRACPTIAAGVTKASAVLPDSADLRCQVALSHHGQQLVTYQPPSHYWPLQALETGIFLAAAFALIGATVWRVGRRATRTPTVGESRERTADPPRVGGRASPHPAEPAAASDLTRFPRSLR